MTRRVTLVCGPPCGGKNTWIRRHAAPADLLLDYDQAAQLIGSPQAHRHRDQQIKEMAEQWMLTHMTSIGHMLEVTAWVIRTAPQPQLRTHYAHLVRATSVVVLHPPMQVALRRATHRPPGTARAVRSWYWQYRPAKGEHTVRDFVGHPNARL